MERSSWKGFLREAAVTCGFLGRVPKLPGAAGTFGGFLIALALPAGPLFPLWAGLAAAALLALGWPLASWAEQHFGGKDPPPFVLDEAAGYLVTLLLVEKRWVFLTLGFFLFRLLDVWKPFPARRVERLAAGAGIFLDDLVAGAYACMVLGAYRSLFPEL